MKDKLVAAGIHLGVSLLVAGLILVLLFLIWFPSPLMSLGAVQGVQLLLLVDLAIGPLLTLLVFKKGKPSLVFDLSTIVVLQIAALSYGLSLVHSQTPSYLVLTYEGLYVVSRYEESTFLTEEQIEQLNEDKDGSALYAGKIPVLLLSEPENQSLRSAQNNGFMFSEALAYYLNISVYQPFQDFEHLISEGTAVMVQDRNCVELKIMSPHGEELACIEEANGSLGAI